MARSKTIYSGKSKSHKVRGKRYNPNVSRYKLFICHILSKLSVNKEVTYKKNRNVDSQNKSREIGVFSISEDVEKEYYAYKIKKENKNRKNGIKISFYNSDGSFSCIGILLGMCSDEDYIRRKSRNLFFGNLEKILNGDDFKELMSMCFSVGLCLYLLSTLFFNIPESFTYYF